MKGDEWMVFAIAMSPLFLLANKLYEPFYSYFMLFVEANRYLSAPSITIDKAHKAHELIKQFLTEFMQIYPDPDAKLKPNMHIMLHRLENILNYSSSHIHWAYPIERFNKDLKDIPNNHKDNIERTFLERFLKQVHKDDYFTSSINLKFHTQEEKDTLRKLFNQNDIIHNFNNISDYTIDEYQNSADTPFNYGSFLALQKPTSRAYGFEELPPSCIIKSMKIKRCAKFTNSTHLQCLVDFYTHRYDQAFHGSLLNFTSQQSIPLDIQIHKFNAIDLLGNYFKSMEFNTKLSRGSYAQAYYDIFEGGKMTHCPASRR